MAKAPKRPKSVPSDAVWDVDEWLACARDEQGRFQGQYRNWYPDGTLKYDGFTKDNEMHGEHWSYHPDGTLFRRATWVDGVVHDDDYLRTHGETSEEFPEDVAGVAQIWRVEHRSRDGIADDTSRYFDEAGRELDLYGQPVPARPTEIPAEARWQSSFSVRESLQPSTARELGAGWFGKLEWTAEAGRPDEPHGWVEGRIKREDGLRLGRWRWWSPSGTLLREEEHDEAGMLVAAKEWDDQGRPLLEESNADARAALATALDGAYEILLGRPLSAFDPGAAYAFFFCIEDGESAPSAIGLEGWDDLTWDDLSAPASGRSARDCDLPGDELSWERFRMDHGRSIFFVDDQKLRGPSGKKHPLPLEGATLAAAAKAAGLTPADLLGDLVYVRAQTDGSLRDAMAAATWTMSAPRGLVEEDGDCEERWAKALTAAVHDDRLLGHLKMLCVDQNSARSSGGFFLGADLEAGMWDWAMGELPGEAVAAWQFGEGYASAVVVKLSGKR